MSQKGQAILEYVLLLTIIVTLSALILAQMSSRDPDNPGFLIRHWQAIREQIGKDNPAQY